MEKLKDSEKLFIIIRTMVTKTVLYQGQIVDKFSYLKPISKSGDSVEIKLLSSSADGKPKPDLLRLKVKGL